MNGYLRIGPISAYNGEILMIDGNTGTQFDVPPHSIPHPDTNLPNAGPAGRIFTDKVPAWQFGGEACVIDCRGLFDTAPEGQSPLVKKNRVIAWEREHRSLGFGDVVLFRSDYSDKFYQPLPAGRRFLADPVEGSAPAWPDPDPECMEYLASKKVMALATDSASMGPIPDLAEPTHLAGLKYGMVWTESGTGFDQLPDTGAFYCLLTPKHADGPYAEARAIAIVGEAAPRLIESAKNKRAVDLSVLLSTEYPVTWPGRGAGRNRVPYLKVPLQFAPNLGTYHQTHVMDAHVGTHLVPPSYALPPPGFNNRDYPAEVRPWLAEYEKRFGPRGTSTMTTEQVPLAWTCGLSRTIDVKHRVGTTEASNWPESPEIRLEDIQQDEKLHGPLAAGSIVIFTSGYSDTYFKSFPEGNACLSDPLNGKREGWPALGPEAIAYLATKGIRCVGTDGPSLGGVDPKRALSTYWTLGTKNMVAVEFLTGVDKMPAGAFFLFAPIKIRGCHGGPGRAIALF
jgi:kynurenine formamidase